MYNQLFIERNRAMGPQRKIKVLIIDDSLVSREVLKKGLMRDTRLEVVGVAGDPYEAVDKIADLEPDVLTLDINMPRMDGITFLKKLMAQHPMPVVVISSSVESVFEAMESGAVDFVAKPEIHTPEDLDEFLLEVIQKIKIAAVALMKNNIAGNLSQDNKTSSLLPSREVDVITIGASTGGTDALLTVLKNLPVTIPGIVIVQHMPPVFTRMYAERLNNQCQLQVKEAATGDVVETGKVFIAPGNFHMKVVKEGSRYKLRCYPGEKVSGHCPSVDVLFQSVAETVGRKAVGIILTGMGSDGAKGLLAMRKNGAYTFGQNKDSCVVYGMPMVAYNMGAVVRQLPLDRISTELIRYLQK